MCVTEFGLQEVLLHPRHAVVSAAWALVLCFVFKLEALYFPLRNEQGIEVVHAQESRKEGNLIRSVKGRRLDVRHQFL